MMATEVRETPRSMINQFIQHHQSSKTSHRPGLRNRIRSTSLGEGPPAETQRSGERTRRGQRTTNAKLSTSEFTPHGAIDQFLQIAKTTQPTRRKRAVSAQTPAAAQAANNSMTSASRWNTTVSRLRSAATEVHKPTPRSMISAFVHQAIEETPVAVTHTALSYLDVTASSSDSAPKRRRKSIREESFLENLTLEPEEVGQIQSVGRKRSKRDRPPVPAFKVISKSQQSLQKGSGTTIIVTAEVHRSQETPAGTDDEETEELSTEASIDSQTVSPDGNKENDKHKSSVNKLSRRSQRLTGQETLPMSPNLSLSSRTPKTQEGALSPSHSMTLRSPPRSPGGSESSTSKEVSMSPKRMSSRRQTTLSPRQMLSRSEMSRSSKKRVATLSPRRSMTLRSPPRSPTVSESGRSSTSKKVLVSRRQTPLSQRQTTLSPWQMPLSPKQIVSQSQMSRSSRQISLSQRQMSMSPRQSPSSNRPLTPRQSPLSQRQTPSSPRQTQLSQRRTPSSPRQTQLSQRKTPLSQRRTPSSPRQTQLSQRKTPSSQRKTPSSPRQTPLSQRKTPLSQRRTPSSPRQTPLSQRKTPLSQRKTPSSPRQTQLSQRRTPSSPRQTPSSQRQSPSVSSKQSPFSPMQRSLSQTSLSPRQMSPSPRQTPLSQRRRSLRKMSLSPDSMLEKTQGSGSKKSVSKMSVPKTAMSKMSMSKTAGEVLVSPQDKRRMSSLSQKQTPPTPVQTLSRGQTPQSQRQMSLSPRKMSLSPKGSLKKTPASLSRKSLSGKSSPNKSVSRTSLSQRHTSLRQTSLSPRQMSLSPRQMSLSPTLSPRQTTLSPRQPALSQSRRSLRQTTLSPKQTSHKRKSLSPNSTLKKTPDSVSKKSGSKTSSRKISVSKMSVSVTAGGTSAVSRDDGRMQGENRHEDISRVKEGQTGREEEEGEGVNTQEETNYNKSLLSYFRQQTQDVYSSMASVAEDDAPVGDNDLGDDHVNTTHGRRSDANMNRVTTGAHRLGTPDIINAAKEKAKVPILWRSPRHMNSVHEAKKHTRVEVTHSEPWLWEKKKPPTITRRVVTPDAPVIETSNVKQRRKSTPPYPRLPARLTRNIFTHFSRHSNLSKDTFDEVEKVADIYWKNVVSDLAAYAKHANRGTIFEADVELLLKRQRFVTDKTAMYTLVEKHMSLEHRQLIIPIAHTGNEVVPKQ